MGRLRARAASLECPWDAEGARACLDRIDGPCEGFDVAVLYETCADAWACPD